MPRRVAIRSGERSAATATRPSGRSPRATSQRAGPPARRRSPPQGSLCSPCPPAPAAGPRPALPPGHGRGPRLGLLQEEAVHGRLPREGRRRVAPLPEELMPLGPAEQRQRPDRRLRLRQGGGEEPLDVEEQAVDGRGIEQG